MSSENRGEVKAEWKMKVQRYVAAVTVMILALGANDARAEFELIGPAINAALSHVVGTPAPGPSTNGRPGAPTSTEPAEYADLLKELKAAPAGSGLRVEDAQVLKEHLKLDVEKKTFNVTPANVQKLVNWTEFYKKYREGTSKCADDKNDKSAQAMRALLDDFVGYLRATLGKEKVAFGAEQKPLANLDERVVLAYVHAFKQVLEKKKSSFVDLGNKMDAGDQQLLDMVEKTPEALFGHKWTDTYTEEEFAKDADKGSKTPIAKEATLARIASMSAPVKMFRIAELVKDAKKQIEERSKDASAQACKPVVPPAPPGTTPTPTPSRTATPVVTKTPTTKPTGTLGTPAPDPGTATPTPVVTPVVTPIVTPGESPIVTPPIQPVPSTPINTENVLNPFNNDLFNALQRNFDDQNRAVLDALREAQDAARRAQLDAQRAIQDAQNANNNNRGAEDALKAALNGRNNDEQPQQQFPIQPQAALAPDQGNDGPQFEPIATPPFAEPTPPPPPMPFFLPPPQQVSSTGPTLPDRPLFDDGPRPLFLPPPNPQASAALELLRFNQEVQRQAMLAGVNRAAQQGVTLGSRLQNRPPRRLRPGVATAPSRYGLPTGVNPTLVRRAQTRATQVRR